MKILFLHPNFPAQFKNIVRHFSASGHDVVFLCQTHYGRSIPNVERICLKGKIGDDYLQKQSVDIFQKIQLRAAQYKTGFSILQKKNWYPDVVVSHASWGCGLHIREFWQDTKVISYLEWWYDPNSIFFPSLESNSYLNVSPDTISKFCLRNQPVALELLNSDIIVTPTMFQFYQIPDLLKVNTKVIFDGIDLSIFSSCKKPSYFKITYGTRGMEPLRGFPHFIKEIPKILEKYPDLVFEIAGSDKAYYFQNLPDGFDSWKEWAVNYLTINDANDSVVWKGAMDFIEYSKWLRDSSIHVYLSEPFVPSWSMIESIICCPNVFLSDNLMTREFALPGFTEFVDHNEEGFLACNKKFCELIRSKYGSISVSTDTNDSLGERKLLFEQEYSMDRALESWDSLLSGILNASN